MPKMFSANPRVSTTATSKKSTSTNNTSITRSMRLSQLTKSSKLSVNRTLANTFGPTDIFLSSFTIPINNKVGTEIGTISSKDVNSFSFVYTLSDTSLFYIQSDKLYTNKIFTDRSYAGHNVNITSDDGTYKFSKNLFLLFQQPPVVANLIAPIIVSQGQTSTVIDLTNTFYDVNGHILTYTLNNDNPDLLSMSINEYKLRLTYNTSNTGISNITITAEDDYNEFAVTMVSVLVVPLNPQYNITVNPLPDALPDPIVNLINDEIISYTELDSSYINISVDDYNILSEDEKRNLIKTNITSLISKYGSTINPDTGSVDPDVILDVYTPIDMLPFPSLGFNIDKVRIIDGSKQGNIDIASNIENSALYVYTKPGSIVSISLINDDVISVEQLTNTTFNVSINNNQSEVKNTGDFINLPNDRVIILSSILITKNNPPVAYDINYSFIEDTTLNVIDLSGSDNDIETNRVSTNYIRYIISTLPQHGIIDVLENVDLVSTEIKYTPTANYFGPDTFSYYIKDNYGIVSNTATVNINVINVNYAPVFRTDNIPTTTNEDSVYTYTIEVSDEDGDNLTITADILPSWLTLTDNRNNTATLTGTPLQEHVGNNNVKIVANDSNSGETNLEFVINVINVNVQPTGQLDISGVVMEGETVEADTTDINDEDGILTYTYQWELSTDNLTWTVLTGETNNTYIVPKDQGYVGDYIRVKAVSSDPYGNTTSHTSSSYEILIFNDPPTDIQISSNEIYESYEIGKEIGTLTSSDIDSTVFTYSVNDNKFIINNDKLLSNHVFEYGPNNTYAIDITTTDETNMTYTKTMNILVKRLWEYTILSSTTVAIGDNTNNLANGTVLGTNLTGSIIIPSTIYDNGNTYTVTNIYQNAFNGSNVDKITFSGDTTYTLDIPLKQNFQVTQVDEDYILHQLEEV
mgnify:CR=1 FL=1